MSPEELSTAPAPAPEPIPEPDASIDERVYMLGELLEPEHLDRLRRTFSSMCGSELAICDIQGRRLDTAEKDVPHDCQPCLETNGSFVVPVTWKSHVLGKVVVRDPNPCENSRELANLIADVLASLCRAQAHIRKRVNELSTIYDLGGLFARSQDLETILGIAARRICEVMNVKAASIRLLNEVTGALYIAAEHNLSERYIRKGPVQLRDNPIDAAAFEGEIVYIEDARTDPRIRYPKFARKEGIVSGLCSPMSYRGHTVGVLRIYSGMKQRFSKFDVELLRAVASQAAAAIIHSRLFEESMAAEVHERHLRQAGQIQRRMIPDQPPRHDRIRFGQVYEPSLDVGGDFFDYLELPQGNLGIAIADVVGKGLPGALMMASVRAALRAHALSIFNINEIIAEVNRHMCRDTRVSEFATLFYGVVSPNSLRLTYCNAGHNPPLLLRGNSFIPLDTGGMVIGVLPDATFEKGIVDLAPGDVLVFYTDGVTEALDYDDNLYGLQRLKDSILRYREIPAQTLANQLLWDVRRFAGLTRQSDDLSLLVAKID